MRRAAFLIVFAAILDLCIGLASAAVPAKPADHHGYRWGTQKLLCTSVKSERRPNDNVVITFKAKRYWCSKPAVVGTAAKAAVAVRTAYQENVNPGVGGLYDFEELSCSGTGAVWKCAWQTPGFAGSAKVVFTAKGPTVTFG